MFLGGIVVFEAYWKNFFL